MGGRGYEAIHRHPTLLRAQAKQSMALIQRPLAVRAVERKRRHVDFEPLALRAFHLVTAGHEAGCGLKRDAAGVFEPLAGSEHRLLTDHAFAADFLPVSGAVGDDPVPRPELHGLLAGVGDDYRVGPEKLTFFDRRPFRHEVRLDGDLDLAGNSAVHTSDSFEIMAHHIQKPGRNQSPLSRDDLPATGVPILSLRG